MKLHTSLLLATSCLLASVTACNSEVGETNESPAAEANQTIENGVVHPLTDALIAKTVRMERPDGSTLGSGALLANNWVLTAAHLFPAGRIADPRGTLQVRLGNEVLLGSEIFVNPNGLDVALVRLSDGFLINGKRTGFSRPLYTGTVAGLVGQTLDCWGFGANDAQGNGAGTLRQANQKAVGYDANYLWVERNSSNQLLTSGDSGAVCFLAGKAVGVHHGRDIQVNGVWTRGLEVPTPSFAAWATGQVMARPAATLHRTVVSCAGQAQSTEGIYPAANVRSMTCASRFQEQCINDGTFDSFYMEWCDYSGATCRLVAPGHYFCDSGATPAASAGTCRPTKAFRTTLTCKGEPLIGEQAIDLTTGYSNYTCNNRFTNQCLTDGTFDSYQSEWCEYTCQ